VFFVCAIDNGGAADLGNLLAMTKERPAADFLATNDVLDEENSSVEPKRKLIEQFNVLEQIVVRVTSNLRQTWF